MGGKPVKRMIKWASKARDELDLKKDKFFENLQKIVIDRDITPEKMKNASGLNINLSKFNGYDMIVSWTIIHSKVGFRG